jgi:hypothetical protein
LAECRELPALADEFLDRHVDQVGGIIHGLSSPVDGADRHVPCAMLERADPEEIANGLVVTLHGTDNLVITQGRQRGKRVLQQLMPLRRSGGAPQPYLTQ